MSESEVLKQVATYGVGGLIAAFMFLLYRRDLKEAREQVIVRAMEAKVTAEAVAQKSAEQSERLGKIVDNNTRAMATIESTNAQLARAVEALAKEADHGRHR